ncbi:hypothetical protein [uncultured Xanthomonas sp.]|uniref:hypothetical protein n=1 Tax=uncultured Xanthomonas sp. TaxID=152831 RepID=UPI0025FE5177|nr:hypothetical protein [uncultured Xanthomonas sp.]
MTAPKDALEQLHAAVATKLSDTITAMDSDSKGLASILNVARQFLKDNGIDVAATPPGSPLGKLADKVSEFPFDPAESGSLN